MSLTAADRHALDRDGYVVVASALDRNWVEALLLAFDGADQSTGTQHVEIGPSTPGRDAWDALARHPLILEAARHILGRPFVEPGMHGRNPLPGYGQQGLHADWMTRSSGDEFFVVTAIFMLDAFTEDNGATRVVPGSHRITAPIAKSYAQPLAHHPKEAIVTGPSGSVLIFNGHLWHSGTRNVSNGPRRAVQMVIRAR
ncbi:MAG: phytanoyl-CoA dioxygenase family protein [Gammaproteobacteria bacterium]|nr:phytanoyl-CoA dioxygenase family protein [Gammaproteobacteria bacterium]